MFVKRVCKSRFAAGTAITAVATTKPKNMARIFPRTMGKPISKPTAVSASSGSKYHDCDGKAASQRNRTEPAPENKTVVPANIFKSAASVSAALAGAGTRHTLFAAKKISAMASSAHA